MADRYIPEHRRTAFKARNTFKPDELRRRREEQQVEIRKAKREEQQAKRRNIPGRDAPGAGGPGSGLGAATDSDDEGGNIESEVGQTLFLPPPLLPATCSGIQRWYKPDVLQPTPFASLSHHSGAAMQFPTRFCYSQLKKDY